MPLYEFSCSSCGHVFEELIFRQSEIEELECPKCGVQQVNKLMSSFSAGSAQRSAGSTAASSGGGCGPGSFS
jgi:putative FmdB family regulatory protein